MGAEKWRAAVEPSKQGKSASSSTWGRKNGVLLWNHRNRESRPQARHGGLPGATGSAWMLLHRGTVRHHARAIHPATASRLHVRVQDKGQCHRHCEDRGSVPYLYGNIETAVFKVAAPIAMISAQIDDVLRSAIPDMNLDEAYSAKDKMVQQILDELRAAMFPHGYE